MRRQGNRPAAVVQLPVAPRAPRMGASSVRARLPREAAPWTLRTESAPPRAREAWVRRRTARPVERPAARRSGRPHLIPPQRREERQLAVRQQATRQADPERAPARRALRGGRRPGSQRPGAVPKVLETAPPLARRFALRAPGQMAPASAGPQVRAPARPDRPIEAGARTAGARPAARPRETRPGCHPLVVRMALPLARPSVAGGRQALRRTRLLARARSRPRRRRQNPRSSPPPIRRRSPHRTRSSAPAHRRAAPSRGRL